MSFAHPLFLTAVPAAAIVMLLLQRGKRRAAFRYSHLPFLVAAARPPRWPCVALEAASAAGAMLLAAGLADPRIEIRTAVRGAAVICVDTSASMATEDVKPSRAAAAAEALGTFAQRTPDGTPLALVAFAGNAELVQPLSRDRDEFTAALRAIPPPNGNTAIGDALALALRVLPAQGSRAVVLVTDGGNNTGEDPMLASRRLAAAHVRLFTVGVGKEADEHSLRAYAAVTGGLFVPSAGAGSLAARFAELDSGIWFRRERHDAAVPTLAAAGALMVLTRLAGMAAGSYP
jgi:Ca-activated chloride channel family protein